VPNAGAPPHTQTADALALPRAGRVLLGLQREVDRLLSPFIALSTALTLRFGFGFRIEAGEEIRRRYRQIADEPGPILICANHLTMIDSFLIGWALGHPLYYVRRFSRLPWNVPERSIFASNLPLRLFAYVFKCIPVVRGGRRVEVAKSLARVVHTLRRGETTLLFPEGGRSRSGRVELENAAPGVGRIFRAVPGCRVLCVYLRGRRQTSFSAVPARRDRFQVAMRLMEPKTEDTGLRASREVARQITATLIEMEQALP
jgi:hypothetical protein